MHISWARKERTQVRERRREVINDRMGCKTSWQKREIVFFVFDYLSLCLSVSFFVLVFRYPDWFDLSIKLEFSIRLCMLSMCRCWPLTHTATPFEWCVRVLECMQFGWMSLFCVAKISADNSLRCIRYFEFEQKKSPTKSYSFGKTI